MRNWLLAIGATTVLAISLTYLYSQAVIISPEGKFRETKQRFYLNESTLRATFELAKDAYLLKVKHTVGKDRRKEILLNGNNVAANTWPNQRIRRQTETTYIYIRKEVVRPGDNTIDLTFSNNPPAYAKIILTNYRKQTGGIYVLFPDSVYLPTCKVSFFKPTHFFHFLILLLGMTTCLTGGTVLVGKQETSSQSHRHLFLSVFISLLSLMLLMLAGWISSNLGYPVLITPEFFWKLLLVILFPLIVLCLYIVVTYLSLKAKDSDSLLARSLRTASGLWLRIARPCLTERKFDIKLGLVLFLLVITANLWVYWPSFFHLFRHDEWFLFFSSKDVRPDLQFIIEHIDWQLRLPYDRLIFRPIHHGMLAVNRVLFDVNYIGPHIVTFIKHILAALCLWLVMWRYSQKWISVLFALLFCVLVVNADPVMWPHLDAYITTTIFTILAIITFCETAHNRISISKGFTLTAILLFLNMLTTEIAFLMPFVFFCAYWIFFRNLQQALLKRKDRYIWLVLLLPLVLWGAFFSLHICFAYPNLEMTHQSETIGLWMPFVNMARAMLVLLSAILFPMLTTVGYPDKMYFNVPDISFVFLIVLIFVCIRLRRKTFHTMTEDIILSIMLVLSMLAIICFSRASYINSLLHNNNMSSHYVYCISALVIFAIYALFDFDKIASIATRSLLLFSVLASLIIIHAFATHQGAIDIETQTAPLKKYFDSVRDFVAVHRKEPDFSFKIIDRPPKTKSFYWYHETCIDGLFNHYMNNKDPKYVLEYDYVSQNLEYYVCDNDRSLAVPSNIAPDISEDADYVNSIGMQFKKVSGQKGDFLMSMFEVTQKQWKDIMRSNPSRFKDDDRPVESVSYYMVREFIERLNKVEAAGEYRLPTEEEYLYLVSSYIISFAAQQDSVDDYAWLKDNAEGVTHPVGGLCPMPTGFYDLIGNVWEWTENSIYYHSAIRPPRDSPRICFGGSWREKNLDMDNLTTNYPLDFRHEHLGFRLVREIEGNRQN